MTDQFPTVKTLEDYIRAAVVASPADRPAQLREAEKLAVDCFSMRALLRELIKNDLGDDALRRRIADQVLTMATAEQDISGIRDAADFERTQMGNEAAAFTILDESIDLFSTPFDRHGLVKYGLGELEPAPGYVFVLLAQDFAKLPNGRGGVVRALTVGRDAHIENADDLEDIANGWIEHIDADEGNALLAHAQELQAAEEPLPAPDPPSFPDPHPPGEPFPAVRPTFGPEPSPSALLDLIRSHITQTSLETIAEADYGMDFRSHLAALTAIKDTGLVSTPTHWVPEVVLSLYRWHTGGETDHLARALCCTVLSLDASLLYPTAFMVTTAPYLVESCLVLGGEYVAAARQLLAWRYCVVPERDSDSEVDRQSSVLAALLLDVLSGAALPDWPAADLDLARLDHELSGATGMPPTSTKVWRHLLALALPTIPDDRLEHLVVASALAAVE